MPTALRPAPAARATDATEGSTTWIEIDRSAYLGNLRFFRRLLGGEVELSAVVKANAYGHGLEAVAALAAEGGADSFCVHSMEEALALRGAGHQRPILVLGHVPLARLDQALAADLRLALFNRANLERLAELTADGRRRARVHLEVETGTHRLGFVEDELDGVLEALRTAPGVVLEGVYTHFANIEDTTDHTYARAQLARFERLVERVTAAGFSSVLRHTACSAAALVVPATRYELVRLGIAQYGFWPSKETLLSYRNGDRADEARGLRPVLTWKTRVAQLKPVPAGAYIGYGCSHQTTRETRLAVLPIGYSEGYDRRLSNQAHVLVRGRRAPVRGRVCMNLTMVDVTDIPDVALEDEVVLLGRQGGQAVTAEQLAAWIGTIHYEVVARLPATIPRRVVDHGPGAASGAE